MRQAAVCFTTFVRSGRAGLYGLCALLLCGIVALRCLLQGEFDEPPSAFDAVETVGTYYLDGRAPVAADRAPAAASPSFAATILTRSQAWAALKRDEPIELERMLRACPALSREECYGELTEHGLESLIAGWPPECGALEPGSTLYDLGSGFGHLLLYFWLHTGLGVAKGIEINGCRATAAAALGRRASAALAGGTSAAALSFQHGDVRASGFRDATHVLLSSQCWRETLVADVFRLAKEAPRLRCIVQLSNARAPVNVSAHAASWGSAVGVRSLNATWRGATATFYVHRPSAAVTPAAITPAAVTPAAVTSAAITPAAVTSAALTSAAVGRMDRRAAAGPTARGAASKAPQARKVAQGRRVPQGREVAQGRRVPQGREVAQGRKMAALETGMDTSSMGMRMTSMGEFTCACRGACRCTRQAERRVPQAVPQNITRTLATANAQFGSRLKVQTPHTLVGSRKYELPSHTHTHT